jgi:hypothetical protein
MTPIAAIEDGSIVRITGRVRPIRAPLTSPLTNKPCVYWDVRRGLYSEPHKRESQTFWLEDASGRALISIDGASVEVHAERKREVMEVANADYAAASERLAEIKTTLRTVQGHDARALHQERTALAKVVTLMLAIRAHARGRVHIAGTLADQERWIRDHASDAADRRSVKLMVDSWEVVIDDGAELEIAGTASIAPMPNDAGGGYRERATCIAVRADTVRGVGAHEQREEPARVLPSPKRRPATTLERAVLVLLAALSAAVMLGYLLRC